MYSDAPGHVFFLIVDANDNEALNIAVGDSGSLERSRRTLCLSSQTPPRGRRRSAISVKHLQSDLAAQTSSEFVAAIFFASGGSFMHDMCRSVDKASNINIQPAKSHLTSTSHKRHTRAQTANSVITSQTLNALSRSLRKLPLSRGRFRLLR